MYEPDAIVRELTQGRGYVVLEGLYDAETVAEARTRILELAAENAASGKRVRTTIFRAQDQVYNLIDKGRVFERMVQEPTILAVFSRILGSELKLGSFAARIIRRGLDRNRARIAFPFPMYAAVRLVGALPASVSAPLLRRSGDKE